MVHRHVLDAIEEEEVLGQVQKTGLQDRVDDEHAQEEGGAAGGVRALGFGQQCRAAQVPPDRQGGAEPGEPGELPGHPERHGRREGVAEPGDDGAG